MTTLDELRVQLTAIADAAEQEVPDPSTVFDEARREARRRRRRQSWGFAAAAAILLAVVVIGALAIAAEGDGEKSRISTDPESTEPAEEPDDAVPDTTPTEVTVPVEPPSAQSEIVLGPTPTGVTVGAPIPIEGNAQVAFDSVWIAGEGIITRLDIDTFEVDDVIELPGNSGLDFGAGSLWVGTGEGGEIVRIDEATHEIVATIDLGIRTTSGHFAFDSLWAIHNEDGLVSRIDPDTNEVVAIIEVGGSPRAETGDHAGSIWVADYENSQVFRIDPETNTLAAVVPVPEDFGNYDATTEGGVWVGVSSLEQLAVGSIDPSTNTLGELFPSAGAPGGLYVDADNVWQAVQVGCGLGSCELAVARMDPVTGAVIDLIELRDVVTEGGGIWGGGDLILVRADTEGSVPLFIGDPG